MGNEEENIYDDQYWYEKAKKDYAEPEPRHEDQDKEYGPDALNPQKSLIDLTGHWFVSFGVEVDEAKMEGSRILTLNGNFDPDELIDILSTKVQETIPKYAKDILDKYKQKVVIRSFNRIDPVGVVGAVSI